MAYSYCLSANARQRVAALCFAVLLFWVMAVAEMLLPEAPGSTVYENSGTTVDASHADQGYIMVKHKKNSKKLKVRVSLGGETLTYDLNSDGEYEVFPLQLGSGKYKVQVYAQAGGNKYSALSSVSLQAEIADETLPYLYPNQYINYDQGTLAVSEAEMLCDGKTGPQEMADEVYNYLVTHIVYDYMRALTVTSDYLPDLNDVFTQSKGICFDFAAMMACMLRSQGVPAKLVIGYADSQYHAWNEVLIDGTWKRYDATAAVCNLSVKKYTAERWY